jgi:hypothetical protein
VPLRVAVGVIASLERLPGRAAPESGTTSMVGSYWALEPRHTQSGTSSPNVEPPSDELVTPIA